MSVIFHLQFTGVFAVFDSADGSHSEHSVPMTSMTTQTPGAFSSLATPSSVFLWDLCLVPWGSQLLHTFWVVFSSVTVSIFTLIMVFLVFVWLSCHDIYRIYGQNTTEIYFLTVLENNTKVKVLAGLVHSAASLSRLQMAIFSF